MLKKAVVLGSYLSLLLGNPALAQAPYFKSGILGGGDAQRPGIIKNGLPSAGFTSGNTSQAAGLIGVIGGYRFIFNQGATFGMDVSSNYLSGNDMKKAMAQLGLPFNNQLKRDFNVVPSFSFGKMIDNHLHIALGLGLGIAQVKHRVVNVDPSAPVPPSQTTLGFVPSFGAEYAWTKNISFIGNVSYEMYRKVNAAFSPKTDPALPGSSYWSAIKPKFLAPKAGIIYRF